MKLRPALLLTAMLTLPLAALAQPPAPAPDAPRAGMHHPPSPERMTERMRRDLGLDEQQTAQLQELNARHASEMKRLHEEHESALREILTPEQWTKFEEQRQQRRDRRREHRAAPQPPA